MMTVRAVAKVSVVKADELRVAKFFLVIDNVAVDVRAGELGIVLGG